MRQGGAVSMCWHTTHAQKDSTLVGKPYTTSTMLQGRPLQQSRLFTAGCQRAQQSEQPLPQIMQILQVKTCVRGKDQPLALWSSRLPRQARHCAVGCASLD